MVWTSQGPLQVWGCSHAALTHTHTWAYLPASGSQLRMAAPGRIWAFGKGFMNPHVFEIVNLNKSRTYLLVFFTFKQILLWLVNKTHLNITAELTVFYFVLSQSVLYFLWAGQSGEATQERLRKKQKYYTHRCRRQEACSWGRRHASHAGPPGKTPVWSGGRRKD